MTTTQPSFHCHAGQRQPFLDTSEKNQTPPRVFSQLSGPAGPDAILGRPRPNLCNPRPFEGMMDATEPRPRASTELTAFFQPRVVAVVGASRERNKIGSEILHNLLTTNFTGRSCRCTRSRRRFSD